MLIFFASQPVSSFFFSSVVFCIFVLWSKMALFAMDFANCREESILSRLLKERQQDLAVASPKCLSVSSEIKRRPRLRTHSCKIKEENSHARVTNIHTRKYSIVRRFFPSPVRHFPLLPPPLL